MSAWPDSGPGEDGGRTVEQWKNAMSEDMGILMAHIKETVDLDMKREINITLVLAAARKEARRLVSDVERFAKEIHGITREQLDAERV